MPIIPINNSKLLVMNEQKTRGLILEYPTDMGLGELLDRINEVRQSVIKSLEQELKDKEEKKEENSKIEPILND